MYAVYKCDACLGDVALSDSACAHCNASFAPVSDNFNGTKVFNNKAGRKVLVELISRFKAVKYNGEVFKAAVSQSGHTLLLQGKRKAQNVQIEDIKSFTPNRERQYIILGL